MLQLCQWTVLALDSDVKLNNFIWANFRAMWQSQQMKIHIHNSYVMHIMHNNNKETFPGLSSFTYNCHWLDHIIQNGNKVPWNVPVLTHRSQVTQNNISTSLQIMASGLFGAKPLAETMLPYCQLNPTKHASVKFYIKFRCFLSTKCTWKCSMWNGNEFVSAFIDRGMDGME